MPRKPRDDTSFEIVPLLDSRCVGCQRDREPEGETYLHEGTTFYIQTDDPCDCGETRVKVGFRVEAG